MREPTYPRVVYLASYNQHKVSEIQSISKNKINVKSLFDLDQTIHWSETGSTFEENALIKALAVQKHTHSFVLGDDSGLVVPALNGEPGIYSARYSGEGASDDANLQKLLKKMASLTNHKRNAYFECTLAFIHKNKQTNFYKGIMEGHIRHSPLGTNGFGYDSIFVPKYTNKTLAQMLPSEKNSISHRKKALEQWLAELS